MPGRAIVICDRCMDGRRGLGGEKAASQPKRIPCRNPEGARAESAFCHPIRTREAACNRREQEQHHENVGRRVCILPISLHFDNSFFVPLLFSIKEAQFRTPGTAFSGVSPVDFPRGFPHTPAFEVTSTSWYGPLSHVSPRRARDVALGASGFSLRSPHPSPDQGHVVP